MRRLVFVTQRIDPEHSVLAAAVPKIRALAARVDEVDVLALSAVPDALPENCRVHLFGAPTKGARTARYLAALAPALRRRPLALVAHMSPVYAVLAAPLARPLGIRVLLWFTQARGGRLLRVAVPLVSAILTVDRRSVPLASTKVRAIGHGIDLAGFPCREPREQEPPLRLLALGRYNPVKGYDDVLRALASLPGAELAIHGSVEKPADAANRRELERLAVELGVSERVQLGDAVPRTKVPELLARADALVNATRGTTADKVVFEAAASCVPVFARSPVFEDLLPEELRFADVRSLAERIGAYDFGDAALACELRARVAAGHSVEHWADAVLAAAT